MSHRRRITIASVAAITYFLVFALWLLLKVGGADGARLFSDIAGIFPGLAASACCAAAARRTTGRLRRAWIWIAAGALSFALGDVAWGFYEVVLGIENPLPSWADVGYLGYVPLTLTGLLLFPAAPSAVATRMRTLADALLIGASAFYVSWVLVLRVLFAGDEETGLAKVVALAYPVFDVVMICVVVLVAARARRSSRMPFTLLGLSLLVNGFADTVYAVTSVNLSYAAGSILDAVWAAALLLLAVAATTQKPEAATEDRVPRHLWLRTLLPYSLLVPAGGIAVLQATGVRPLDRVGVALGMVVVTLLVIRQFLTLAENANLTRRLQRFVHELESREGDLQYQAFHDPLTGLANRALFRDRLENAVTRVGREPNPIAVLFLDLDDFKVVNDRLGHQTGDELLVAVAARLQHAVRSGDTVARLGGDEFAILTSHGGSEGARVTANRICDVLREPFHLQANEVDLRASIGVALSEGSDYDADDLLRNADLAMYAAKYAGKGRASYYVPQMRTEVLEHLELKNELQCAVEQHQIRLLYQPIVDLETNVIVGVEALARWQHPRLGLLDPGAFIPLAEKTGLIVPLGLSVLRQAGAQLKAWQQQHQALTMSVNLSARQLVDAQIVSQVAAVLGELDLDPATITLEITESVLMSDTEVTLARLAELKAVGVRLAIDDFGTGYSSLAYLGRFPVDALKIDRSFVMGLSDKLQRSLTATIVGLGDMLGVVTIAEGIETDCQLSALRDLHCKLGQGFLISRPVPASVLSEALAAQLVRLHQVATRTP